MGFFKALTKAISSIFCVKKKKKQRKLKSRQQMKWKPALETIYEEDEEFYILYDEVLSSLLATNEKLKSLKTAVEMGQELTMIW